MSTGSGIESNRIHMESFDRLHQDQSWVQALLC